MLDLMGLIGCTIITENENINVLYCHISPNYIVKIGDKISKGSVIAKVGPKNIFSIPNNPYKDSNGNPTNRCYHRVSFASYNKKRRRSRQSFRIFQLNSFHIFTSSCIYSNNITYIYK